MSFPLTSQENARKRATLFETPDMLEDRIEQQRRGLFDETSIASQTSRRTCDFDKYKVASLRNAALNTFYDDQSHRAYTVSTPESRMDTGMMASRRSGRREHRQGDVTDWVSTSKDNSAKVGIQRELLFEKQTTAQGIPRKQDEQWCVRDKELDERDQSIRCQRPALKSVRDYSKGIHRTDSGSVVSKRTTSSRYRTDKRQMSVVYRQFGADSSVLQVECEEETPTLNSPNDVIIKVQVRIMKIVV